VESLALAAIVLIAGAITGLLMALFGIGGGAFVVPVLDALFARLPGMAQPPFKLAVIASLVAIGAGSSWRAVQVWRNGDLDRRALGRLIAGSVPATVLGVALVSALPGDALRLGFAAMLMLLGLWTLFGRPRKPPAAMATRPPQRRLFSIGAAAGLASSLFGLGGATLLVPLLTMTAGFATSAAAAVSIVFVFLASILSLAVYLLGLASGVTSLDRVTATHLELVALLTASVIVVQQLALRGLRDLPDALRRRLLALYLLLAAAWMLREVLLRPAG
jgi:uncharacterized protein